MTILNQGVPQSSVLSPLLFLFYIDDLHWGSRDLHANLFADNVAILALDSGHGGEDSTSEPGRSGYME